MVALLPLVIVAVGLTASVYGAVFGIPLLALVARPWWAATRSVQRTRPLGTTALGHTIVALAALTGAVVVSVLLGLDDLDTATDVIILAVAVGWLAVCWFATAERLHAYLPVIRGATTPPKPRR
jgi:hypothetical protein